MTALVNSAPGFLSPAAFPFPNGPFGLPNDAPPVTPVPYLIGVMNDNGTNTSRVIPVTATTNPGDAVAVFCTVGIGGGAPLAAMDTQGNSYSLLKQFSGANQAVSVAQNTGRLTAGTDSVTVNWTAGHPQLAIAVGIPAGALGGSGEEWLTYDLFGQTGSSSAPSITLSTATGAPGAPEVILAFSATTAATNGPAAFGQDFTVIGNTAWQVPTAYTGAVAYKVAPGGMARGSLVVWTQQNAPNAGAGLMYLTFRLETRVAPNQPLPLMPPGMQSPAAWQSQPFGLPNEPATGTPQPYFVGYSSSTGTNSVTVPVRNATGARDGIAVLTAAGHTRSSPLSCTDTQGNSYSFVEYAASSQPEVSAFVAQNTRPLTTSDSITVTFKNTDPGPGSVFAVGCPTGAVTSFPGEDWLTYTAAGGASTANVVGQVVSATSPSPFSGPAVIIGIVSCLNSSAFPLLGQGWTVLYSAAPAGGYASSIAVNVVSSYYAANSVVLTAQNSSSANATLDAAFVVLQLETRIASQPGLMAGLPSPPGFIAPASGPDTVPFTPGAINEPQTGTQQPYFVGAGNTAGTSNTAVIPVQNPTGRGDAITVLLPTPGTFGAPLSCTDTQGNSYSLAAYETTLQPVEIAYVAQNTNPLTAADSITVTYATSDFRVRTGVIIGCPAGAVAANPGSTWLTYTAVGTGFANGGTSLASTPSPVSGPAAVLAVISSVVANAFPLVQQGWTVLWSGSPASGYATVVAARVTSSYRAANSVVIAAQSAASGQNITAAFVILQPETRIAPNRPAPDMPPGMLAPGAWQYQPMPRAIGSLAQVITPLVLTGTGSLSAGGGRGLPGAAALAGLGALLGTGHKAVPGAAALSGTGTTTATGNRGLPGSALLSGSGSFTATGHKTVSAAASLAGTGTSLSDARVVHLGHAVLTAPGTVTAVGTRSAVGAAALSGSAVLTCSYLSARIVITGNIMFPDNQSGTYGAAEAETTVIIPGVTDGTYT